MRFHHLPSPLRFLSCDDLNFKLEAQGEALILHRLVKDVKAKVFAYPFSKAQCTVMPTNHDKSNFDLKMVKLKSLDRLLGKN